MVAVRAGPILRPLHGGEGGGAVVRGDGTSDQNKLTRRPSMLLQHSRAHGKLMQGDGRRRRIEGEVNTTAPALQLFMGRVRGGTVCGGDSASIRSGQRAICDGDRGVGGGGRGRKGGRWCRLRRCRWGW